MAYNLRLPSALDLEARARCQRLGISLNALLCVALDAWLRAPVQRPASPEPVNPGHTGLEPVGAVRSSPASGISKLSKQQRREITRLERAARKP